MQLINQGPLPITGGKWAYVAVVVVVILLMGLWKRTQPLAMWIGGLIVLSMIVLWYPRWSYLLPQVTRSSGGGIGS